MQRREAKIGLRHRRRHRRPKERDLAVMIGVGRQTINRLLKSKVAFAITGTKWNGPRFFGLRDKEDSSATEARS